VLYLATFWGVKKSRINLANILGGHLVKPITSGSLCVNSLQQNNLMVLVHRMIAIFAAERGFWSSDFFAQNNRALWTQGAEELYDNIYLSKQSRRLMM